MTCVWSLAPGDTFTQGVRLSGRGRGRGRTLAFDTGSVEGSVFDHTACSGGIVRESPGDEQHVASGRKLDEPKHLPARKPQAIGV